MSSAPVYPYPGGVAGDEPPDPTAGAPGHFAWSRWIKQFVKNLDSQKVAKAGDSMTGDLEFSAGKGIAFPGNNTRITDVLGYGNDLSVISSPSGSLANLRARPPLDPAHVATKGFIDGLLGAGVKIAHGRGGNIQVAQPNGGSVSWTVTFPAGIFIEVPVVVANNSGGGNDAGGECSIHELNAQGCRVQIVNRSGVVQGYAMQWIAIGLGA